MREAIMTARTDLPTITARRFLWLGVAALAIAGIFSVILVAARTPQLSAFKELFSVALVVHVDLSVLMWFLCIAGMGWSLLAAQWRMPYWLGAGFGCMAASTALMALSPLDPHWQVIKSNYIPVLNNLPFLLGLGLLAAGLFIAAVPPLLHALKGAVALPQDMRGFVHAAGVSLLALLAFFLAAAHMPDDVGIELRFETLFWAGGHILQIAYSLLMMAAWLTLTHLITSETLNNRAVNFCYAITSLAGVAHVAGFVIHPFDSPEFIHYHTQVMISLAGIGCTVLAFMVVGKLVGARALMAERATRAYSAALLSSLTLFVAGGVLGLLISGQNVTIPAHYHGAIVAVTLAMMGLAYAMLPRFGYRSMASDRMAFIQPILYGVGQLMHIGGLAYSGGYGVLRKTPGQPIEMAPEVKAALGFMGLGGLLAIIGGLLFVVVMLRARRGSPMAAV